MEQAAGQVEQAVEETSASVAAAMDAAGTEAVAEEYRIQDIPPQIDPDQIVENSIAEATTEPAADEIVVAPEGGDSEIVIETWAGARHRGGYRDTRIRAESWPSRRLPRPRSSIA